MKIFNLPDLGEGLPDAIVREWHVKIGDEVTVDQPLASMETAKALVDVPCPFTGKIEKLFGEPGDTIETGEPLVGFASEGVAATDDGEGSAVDALEEEALIEEEPVTSTSTRPKASPVVRALAKKLGVSLADVVASGQRITQEDVERAAGGKSAPKEKVKAMSEMQTLSPVRRAMVMSMKQSHDEIVPVTISDDADLHAWEGKQDITVRLIRAITHACQQERMLNATFDGNNLAYHLNDQINLGVAVDTPHGLYVPVLKSIAAMSDADLRAKLEQYKQQAQDKSIAQDDLHGATIMLSNFGTLAGRYASPIIVPPMVAIIGIGKARDAVVAWEGQPAVHRIMPLSITVDHRLITGGEAARFLRVMMDELAKPKL